MEGSHTALGIYDGLVAQKRDLYFAHITYYAALILDGCICSEYQ